MKHCIANLGAAGLPVRTARIRKTLRFHTAPLVQSAELVVSMYYSTPP